MAAIDNPTLQKLKENIIAKPFAAVGIAFIFGFLIAMIFR